MCETLRWEMKDMMQATLSTCQAELTTILAKIATLTPPTQPTSPTPPPPTINQPKIDDIISETVSRTNAVLQQEFREQTIRDNIKWEKRLLEQKRDNTEWDRWLRAQHAATEHTIATMMATVKELVTHTTTNKRNLGEMQEEKEDNPTSDLKENIHTQKSMGCKILKSDTTIRELKQTVREQQKALATNAVMLTRGRTPKEKK